MPQTEPLDVNFRFDAAENGRSEVEMFTILAILINV